VVQDNDGKDDWGQAASVGGPAFVALRRGFIILVFSRRTEYLSTTAEYSLKLTKGEKVSLDSHSHSIRSSTVAFSCLYIRT
jgi:hypothetical protein